MQYRSPVGSGPSLKTWPKWASQTEQRTSVRLPSGSVYTAFGAMGEEKLGQPVPDSNLACEENSGLRHPAQMYIPGRCSWVSGLLLGHSVPLPRMISYCDRVNALRHSASVF